MSILGKRVPVERVALVAAAFVFLVGLTSVLTKPRAREITLVARDMAFYIEGDGKTANPVIEARAGETLHIVLRNRDRGFTHDFAVPGVKKAATSLLDWNEQDDITFEAPKRPGTYEYVCRPHGLMMKGTLQVN